MKYFQEIMILPVGANTFKEAMQMASETYHHLKVISMHNGIFSFLLQLILF